MSLQKREEKSITLYFSFQSSRQWDMIKWEFFIFSAEKKPQVQFQLWKPFCLSCGFCVMSILYILIVLVTVSMVTSLDLCTWWRCCIKLWGWTSDPGSQHLQYSKNTGKYQTGKYKLYHLKIQKGKITKW